MNNTLEGLEESNLEENNNVAEENLVNVLKLQQYAELFPILGGGDSVPLHSGQSRHHYSLEALSEALLVADDLGFDLFWEHPFTISIYNSAPARAGGGWSHFDSKTLFFEMLCPPEVIGKNENLFERAVIKDSKAAFDDRAKILSTFGFHAESGKEGERALGRYKKYREFMKTLQNRFRSIKENPQPVNEKTDFETRQLIAAKINLPPGSPNATGLFFNGISLPRELFFDEEMWNLFAKTPQVLIEITQDPHIMEILMSKYSQGEGIHYNVDRLPAIRQALVQLFTELEAI